VGNVARLPNPTYQAIHPSGRFLYSVSEERGTNGRHDGFANAFSIDRQTGALNFIGRQPVRGVGPCHVAVEKGGRFVVVSNYASGSATLFSVNGDGGLDEPCDSVQHRGSGVDPERQEGPHAHSATFSPDGGLVVVADLGLDRLVVYRIDVHRRRLVPNDPPWASIKPRSGPRHCAFHPSGRFLYLVSELSSTITVLACDLPEGMFTELQTLSLLPVGFKDTSCAADVHVAPSGRFVYASNRGHDSIAVFGCDAESGVLKAVGHVSTRGAWPRGFMLDPTGGYLLAANQNSDSVVVFRLDRENGMPSPMGPTVRISMPVCLKGLA